MNRTTLKTLLVDYREACLDFAEGHAASNAEMTVDAFSRMKTVEAEIMNAAEKDTPRKSTICELMQVATIESRRFIA